MGTYLLVFNNTLYESTDSSGTSWVQEPFPPTGAPQGVTALGTVGGIAWVLDSVAPAPLWRRVNQNTYVQLTAANLPGTPPITSDLSPDRVDFYTTPFFIPSSFVNTGANIVGDIGVPGGQTQQMYVLSTDGGQTAQLLSFGNLPFPAGSKLMRFWGDERGTYPTSPLGAPSFFMAQVRDQSSSPDKLYGGSFPNSWNTAPLLQTGTSIAPPGSGVLVQQIADDFIRKQSGTYLVLVVLNTGFYGIVRSTDGLGWTLASVPSAALPQPGLVECDNGTVLVPTIQPSPGFVLRSTDDGQSFQSTLPIPGVNIASVYLKYFPGLDVLFALVKQTQGSAPFGTAVYRSVDQGQSWAQVFTSTLGTAGFVQQVASWMAVTNGVTLWGVDSATAANFGRVGHYATLYDAVVSSDGAGRTPTFWGRYIGHPNTSFNLTSSEVSFLHSRNCRILLIYGGTTSATVGTYQDGVNAANNAINYITNNNLAVPGGKSVWIYCDIEYPSMSPTADFFRGWSDTMFNSSYGGAGGVYGNTSTNAAPQFNTPYCNAYAADSNMRVGSAPALLWANQPIKCSGPSCNPQTLAGGPPAFSTVDVPPCGAPTVLYQYAIHLTIAKKMDAVDFDLANGAGFASMW